MFWPDVARLKEFYATPLGRLVRRHINASIGEQWDALGNDTLLGMGYATPYLHPILRKHPDSSIIAAMPAAQGARYWPNTSDNSSILCDETNLPLNDQQINRIIVIHALEHTEHMRHMLDELWRILIPGGRVMFIVPNRRGLWARATHNPFAQGQPFSHGQLRRLLTDKQFTIMHTASALHYPPSHSRFMHKLIPWLERIGSALWPAFSGVWIMEAEKQIYAGIKEPISEKILSGDYVRAATKPVMTRN